MRLPGASVGATGWGDAGVRCSFAGDPESEFRMITAANRNFKRPLRSPKQGPGRGRPEVFSHASSWARRSPPWRASPALGPFIGRARGLGLGLRVHLGVGSAVLTRRAAPPAQIQELTLAPAGSRSRPVCLIGGCGSALRPRLTRRGPGGGCACSPKFLRIFSITGNSGMASMVLRPGAAVRAVLHVDVEHALERLVHQAIADFRYRWCCCHPSGHIRDRLNGWNWPGG